MKINEYLTQYFNDLPNRWSAHFLAFMALNNILLAIIGYLVSIAYQFVVPKEALKMILAIPFYLPVYAIAFLPISCVIALILLIPFKILLKTNNSKIFKLNLILLFSILSISYVILAPLFDFTSGSAIYIIFTPILLFWIPILVNIIYLLILWKENRKKLRLHKSILLGNKYYKKISKILFIYGFVLFGIIELLLILFGVIAFTFNA